MKSQGLPMTTIVLIIIAVVVLAVVLVFFFGGLSKPKENIYSTTDLATCQNYCLEAQNLATNSWKPSSGGDCSNPTTIRFCQSGCNTKMVCTIHFDDGSSCNVKC
ncbi:MAG: hypothetical protein J7K73_03725 [Nanoarchaeota archaeon]|nr:hypothetical protein [Nanoarchaeota archaeon]